MCDKNDISIAILQKRRNFLNISEDTDYKSLFILVDSEGNDIEGEDLGLLLYRGGTVCDDYFDNIAADAICKYMNYTYASRWTSDESYDIQETFPINLDDVECSRAEWETCTFAEEHNCDHDEDVFLSCTFEEEIDGSTGNPLKFGYIAVFIVM